MTVGYVMKPSREEDFVKVSSLRKNEGIFRSGKKAKKKRKKKTKEVTLVSFFFSSYDTTYMKSTKNWNNPPIKVSC